LEASRLAEIAGILSYHVVNGRDFVGYCGNRIDGTQLRQGATLTIIISTNSAFLNSARALQQDILLSNGVHHVPRLQRHHSAAPALDSRSNGRPTRKHAERERGALY